MINISRPENPVDLGLADEIIFYVYPFQSLKHRFNFREDPAFSTRVGSFSNADIFVY